MTVEELISILSEIKEKDRNRNISATINGELHDIKSVDWMDVSDSILLFIESDVI